MSREPQPVRFDMAGAFMDPHPQGRYVTFEAFEAEQRAHKATLERAEAAWRREIATERRAQYEAGLNDALRATEVVLARTTAILPGSLLPDLKAAIEHERMR